MKLSDLILLESKPVTFVDGTTFKVLAKSANTLNSTDTFPSDMSEFIAIDVSNNMLTDLKGLPDIQVSLNASNNALRDLHGIPQNLIDCDVSYNPGLMSLDGIGYVDGTLDITGTKISTLGDLKKSPPHKIVARELKLNDDLKNEFVELARQFKTSIITSDRVLNGELSQILER